MLSKWKNFLSTKSADDTFEPAALQVERLRSRGFSSQYTTNTLVSPFTSPELTDYGLELHRIELSTNNGDYVTTSSTRSLQSLRNSQNPERRAELNPGGSPCRHLEIESCSIQIEARCSAEFESGDPSICPDHDRPEETRTRETCESSVCQDSELSRYGDDLRQSKRVMESIGRFIYSLHKHDERSQSQLEGISEGTLESTSFPSYQAEACPEVLIRDTLVSYQIGMLPRFTYEEAEGGVICCGVCLENCASGDAMRTLPCHHSFHARCIDRWLLSKPTCPYCSSEALSKS